MNRHDHGGGQQNPVLGTVDRVLQKNPLPPFHVISQYLAPGGGLVALLVVIILGAAVIIWRHKSNLERIRAGNENVFRIPGRAA